MFVQFIIYPEIVSKILSRHPKPISLKYQIPRSMNVQFIYDPEKKCLPTEGERRPLGGRYGTSRGGCHNGPTSDPAAPLAP